MAKGGSGSISIGADTPTGQPPNVPKGPYTTDEHDDESAAPGHDPTRHKPGGSGTSSKIAQESELGSDNAGDDARQDSRSSRAKQPDLPDELAKRPKGPAQP